MPGYPYHSALRAPEQAEPRNRFTLGDSVALVHDIAAGVLPPEFDRCDVLYAEPPWRRGVPVFNERAGIDGVTWDAVMAGVSRVIETATVPVFLPMGKEGIKRLPKPTQQVPIVLHKFDALLNVYNDAWPDITTTDDLTARLAIVFDRVGDFCCGYGMALRDFHRAGKTWVGSDYDPHCIGYIAANAGDW
jgi:hypothetical protein